MTAKTFDSTYEEYLWLREQLGYLPHLAMREHVWNGCDAESQENMLNQFRGPARRIAHYEEIVGEVW